MNSKILIVDDDDLLCEELAEILDGAGYEVATAADGRKGLHAITHAPYDLVLLDLKMPHMDGIEALQQIKKNKTAPKVIVLSANHSVHAFLGEAVETPYDYPERTLGLADGVMNKPYDVESLLDKIRDLLSVTPS